MVRRKTTTSIVRPWARFMPVITAAMLIAAAAFLITPGKADDAKHPSSDPVWSSSFKDLDGNLQNLKQWKGKVAVIYFWATWCAPCHIEAPKLSALYEKSKNRGLVVIGIAVDNADKVRKFVEKNALKNPTVYGGTEAIQLGRDLGNDLGAIPYTAIIDRDGNVVKTIRGDTPEGKLEGIINPLLG